MIIALLATALVCPPSVELGGEAELVSRLQPALISRGLTSAQPPCPVVRVAVERTAAGIRIEARDPQGRLQVRALQDEASAPSVIESLIRSGVSVELRPPPSPSPAIRDPAALSLLAEAAIDDAGTFSSGVRAGVVRPLGPVDLYGRLRWSFAPDVISELATASRNEVELTVGARRGLATVVGTVAAGLAVGAAWSRTGRRATDCDGACGRPVIGDGASASVVVPRIAPSIELARAIGADLSALLSLELALSPFAAGPRVPAWARALPPAEARRMALPADATTTVRASFGLAWGPR